MTFVHEYYPEYFGDENFRPFFASLRSNAATYEADNKRFLKKQAAKKRALEKQ
jgi:hypothetical protein